MDRYSWLRAARSLRIPAKVVGWQEPGMLRRMRRSLRRRRPGPSPRRPQQTFATLRTIASNTWFTRTHWSKRSGCLTDFRLEQILVILYFMRRVPGEGPGLQQGCPGGEGQGCQGCQGPEQGQECQGCQGPEQGQEWQGAPAAGQGRNSCGSENPMLARRSL